MQHMGNAEFIQEVANLEPKITPFAPESCYRQFAIEANRDCIVVVGLSGSKKG